jgi:hypothetical protein
MTPCGGRSPPSPRRASTCNPHREGSGYRGATHARRNHPHRHRHRHDGLMDRAARRGRGHRTPSSDGRRDRQ